MIYKRRPGQPSAINKPKDTDKPNVKIKRGNKKKGVKTNG